MRGGKEERGIGKVRRKEGVERGEGQEEMGEVEWYREWGKEGENGRKRGGWRKGMSRKRRMVEEGQRKEKTMDHSFTSVTGISYLT